MNIQHTVVQGASADDGGDYDGLAVAGVPVTVVDNDSADVVVVPYNEALNAADDRTLVAEGSTCTGAACTLPATDAFAVMLTKAPLGPVTVSITADSQTLLWNGTAFVPSVTLTFTAANAAQIVRVQAVDDTLKEGLHFSRIALAITSDKNAFLGLTADRRRERARRRGQRRHHRAPLRRRRPARR